MALITRAILAADEKVETILTASTERSAPQWNPITEQGVLPLQPDYEGHELSRGYPMSFRTAFISRLTERLAGRMHCQPHQIYEEVFDTCNEIREIDLYERPVDPKVSSQLAEVMQSNEYEALARARTSAHRKPQSKFKAMDHRSHHRSFSFLPGDDVQISSTSNLRTSQDNLLPSHSEPILKRQN